MRHELLAACLALGLTAACDPPPVARPASSPPLAAPGPADPNARGAAVLAELGARLQREWGQFLEDCRTRLPPEHALNRPALAATAELAIDHQGNVSLVGLDRSAAPDFDRAVEGVVRAVAKVAPPDGALVSDDDLVHVKWLFARDHRQAGAATAHVIDVEQPLAEVTERLLARGELERAAARIARAAPSDSARAGATERVMIQVLREVVTAARAPNARRAAVEAIGKANVTELAPELHPLLAPTIATELRVAALASVADLDDRSAVERIVAGLTADLTGDPQLAIAEVEALSSLGGDAGVQAEALVRRSLDAVKASARPPAAALAALARFRIPALDAKLTGWFARGDAGTRAAVCTALSDSDQRTLVARGLRDRDASVRAACLGAISRSGPDLYKRLEEFGDAIMTRVRELARDRDHAVRAAAVGVLADVDARKPARVTDPRIAAALRDPSPEVRAAAAWGVNADEIQTLLGDTDPEVRRRAMLVLSYVPGSVGSLAAMQELRPIDERDQASIRRAAEDEAAPVRIVAISTGLLEEPTLEKLATDDAPEVASAALVVLVERRGRAATTSALLARIASGAGEHERVRIALAWLLAR